VFVREFPERAAVHRIRYRLDGFRRRLSGLRTNDLGVVVIVIVVFVVVVFFSDGGSRCWCAFVAPGTDGCGCGRG